MAYVVYGVDGRIRINLSGCTEVEARMSAESMSCQFVAYEGECDNRSHYVRNSKVIARPEQSTRVQGTTLYNVPTPATIHVEGEPYEVDDSIVELDFDFPGIYEVRIESFPYLDKTVEVVVL